MHLYDVIAAPNISSFQLNLKTTTAYDGDFVNPSVYKIRDMGDKLTADAVQRFYSNSADKNGTHDYIYNSTYIIYNENSTRS